MTYTIESAQTIFSANQIPSPIPATIALFDQLGVDDQLAYLWYAYTEMGRTITPCLLYTSPSPRDKRQSRMPSSA